MGLYINKILEILIIVALSLKITKSNSTTTETFVNSTGNYMNDDLNYDYYHYEYS